MPRFLLSALAIYTLVLLASCDKDADRQSPESLLHGVWVKGNNTGDSLEFYSRDGKHYMKSNQSFNPGMYSPTEREYIFRNGKLNFKYNSGWSVTDIPVDSFTWTVIGQEFEVLGFHIYMFMSSSITKFTFHKIQ